MSTALATVLDPCCGSRMMYFDKQDQRVLFGDIRSEQHTLCDGRALNITPEVSMDFRSMPFADETYQLVVFDPPHLTRCGPNGWMGKKYGILGPEWRSDLAQGFAECFRVLRPHGVLIFKWADVQVPLSQILALTPHKPLFGHKSGRREKTHWMTFMKPDSPVHPPSGARSMKVYVTKYALSNGVFIIDGHLVGDHGKYLKEDKAGGGGYFLTVGRDCFSSRADAVAKVAAMREKKIASLKKQVIAVQKLHPEEVVPHEAAA